ncbi:unnamed protein product [Symbiodinium sp. CCMP2592]|nr:unnamed protein product [Symbiodinium sp. CCMP2592]
MSVQEGRALSKQPRKGAEQAACNPPLQSSNPCSPHVYRPVIGGSRQGRDESRGDGAASLGCRSACVRKRRSGEALGGGAAQRQEEQQKELQKVAAEAEQRLQKRDLEWTAAARTRDKWHSSVRDHLTAELQESRSESRTLAGKLEDEQQASRTLAGKLEDEQQAAKKDRKEAAAELLMQQAANIALEVQLIGGRRGKQSEPSSGTGVKRRGQQSEPSSGNGIKRP